MNIPDRNESYAPFNEREGFCPDCEHEHVYDQLPDNLTDEQEVAAIDEILAVQELCDHCLEEKKQDIKLESMRDDR